MKLLPLLALFSLAGCTGTRPDDLGVNNGQLGTCPDSPNCVSSLALNQEHIILPLNGDIDAIKQVVLGLDRTEVISESENYLYAEFTSRIMRFVDDVEFHYDPETQVSHVRSASRLGKSDLGVNRKRIEQIRTALPTE